MPENLLHWHCDGVTYSVKRLTETTGWLIATGPGSRVRRGKRDLPIEVIEAWRGMKDQDRCRHAEIEMDMVPMERRQRERSA